MCNFFNTEFCFSPVGVDAPGPLGGAGGAAGGDSNLDACKYYIMKQLKVYPTKQDL